MGIKGWILGLATAGAAGEYDIVRYFFHQTVVRGNAERDGTRRMAGTGWDVHIPGIRVGREWLARQPQEEVYVTFWDRLGFHGTFSCCEDSRKAMVRFHDYTSEGLNDYTSIAKFYLSQGFSLMVVNERVHSKDEGTYAGFGCLDRNNAEQWMEYMVECLGEDYESMFHGISMGATAVLIPTGLNLPEQVRVAVSDCIFTSAWEVLSHMLRSMYHMSAFPVMQITNRVVRSEIGHGLDEYNAREEIKKAHIPTLSIHGDRDAFVPCSTAYELYEAYVPPKGLLTISGANHVEACCEEVDRYEHAIEELTTRFFGKEENKV